MAKPPLKMRKRPSNGCFQSGHSPKQTELQTTSRASWNTVIRGIDVNHAVASISLDHKENAETGKSQDIGGGQEGV
jgi:hypothetical protein